MPKERFHHVKGLCGFWTACTDISCACSTKFLIILLVFFGILGSKENTHNLVIAILSNYFENKDRSYQFSHFCLVIFSSAGCFVLFHLSPCSLTQRALVGEKRRRDILPKKMIVYYNVNRLLLQLTSLFQELLIM